MKFAVSNIALTAYDHRAELDALAGLGIDGVEIAPSRVWTDTWSGLSTADVSAYREMLDGAGLRAVGLHSLFYDHPELGLFRDAAGRAATLDYLAHLSAVCRDLGGRTLIWGGGRRRDSVPAAEARNEAVAFMGELCRRVETHGTVFCFEPLGPGATDFVNSALEALAIVEAVDHPAMAVQLDAKALVENGEASAETFRAVASCLVHYHANEPDLGVLGSSGTVNHAALGGYLRSVGYAGYVSIEQRQLDAGTPVSNVARSVEVLKNAYGG